MPRTKSKMPCGFVSSSLNTVSMIFAVSDLEKPRLRRKLSRSSSLRATIRSHAALIPAMNGAGEELAKLASALDQCLAGLKFELGSGVSLCRESFLTRGNMNQIHATT